MFFNDSLIDIDYCYNRHIKTIVFHSFISRVTSALFQKVYLNKNRLNNRNTYIVIIIINILQFYFTLS